MTRKDILVEAVRLNQDRDGLFDGQAHVEFMDDSSLLRLKLTLTPKYGPFQGGKLEFEFNLPASYPRSPPNVRCLTKVYHPNISTSGSVCFSMFSGDFSPSYTLSAYANGLLWLLDNPNNESALNGNARDEPGAYFANVQAALRGLPVKGEKFERSLSEDFNLAPMKFTLNDSQFLHYIQTYSLFELSRIRQDATLRSLVPSSSWWNALVNKTVGEAKFMFTDSRSSIRNTVRFKAAHFQIPSCQIVKELLFVVENEKQRQFVVVLKSGFSRASIVHVASLLDVPVESIRLASRADLPNNVSFADVRAWGNSFDVRLIVDVELAQQKMLYCSIDGGVLEITPDDFLRCLPEHQFVELSSEPTMNGFMTGMQKRASFYFDEQTVELIGNVRSSR